MAAAADSSTTPSERSVLTIRTHTAMKEIKQEEWDALLEPDDSPFLEYSWLYGLEETGCATPETGWNPLHITLMMQPDADGPEAAGTGEVVAAVPWYVDDNLLSMCCSKLHVDLSTAISHARMVYPSNSYVKTHSNGEFIFDHSWASASYNAGLRYYPKMLVAVPFTPASGARILVKSNLTKALKREIRQLLGGFLADVARNNNFSSVHVNFCTDEEVSALQEAGYLHRKSMQFHWRNQKPESTEPYGSFDDYLAAFRAKRRSKIKKERRSIYEEANLRLEVMTGEEIPDSYFDDDTIFNVYISTIEKLYWGRQYLTSDFFRYLKHNFRRHICLIVAYSPEGEVVAGTFNIVKSGRWGRTDMQGVPTDAVLMRFYGRYWGSMKEYKNLHFETCYYRAIEHCITAGLQVMEPGAGETDFKYMRGFGPAEINSMHYIVHPGLRRAVQEFLDYERKEIHTNAVLLEEKSVIRPKSSNAKQTPTDFGSKEDEQAIEEVAVESIPAREG